MKHCNIQLFGTSSIGERGQIVIPAEARALLNIKPGEKFVFFGNSKFINMIKAQELDETLEKIHGQISTKINDFKTQIKEKNEEK